MSNTFVAFVENNSRKGFTRFVPHFLVVLGILFSWIEPHFLFIAALGFFGPGILSELGWVPADEFKQETRRRAAHHAYLMGGVFLTLIVGFNGCGQRHGAGIHEIDDAIPASLVLMLMLLVYYLSSLVRYWGPKKAAFRIITIYASILFISSLGAGLLVQQTTNREVPWIDFGKMMVIAGAMLGSAFLGKKRPLPAAMAMMLATGVFLWITGTWRFMGVTGFPWEVTMETTIYALLLPVTAIISLLVAGRRPPE